MTIHRKLQGGGGQFRAAAGLGNPAYKGPKTRAWAVFIGFRRKSLILSAFVNFCQDLSAFVSKKKDVMGQSKHGLRKPKLSLPRECEMNNKTKEQRSLRTATNAPSAWAKSCARAWAFLEKVQTKFPSFGIAPVFPRLTGTTLLACNYYYRSMSCEKTV
jgi:hypothetical protein